MKKAILILSFILLIVFFLYYFYSFKNKSVEIGSTQTQNNDKKDINNLNLKLPDGFDISVFAKNLPGARVLAFDKDGNIWVSQTSAGRISKLVIENGKLAKTEIIFKNLQNPHGLSFDPNDPNILYIAEETKISKVVIFPSVGKLEKIINLPKGGRHFTRTLLFSPQGKLFVSIGSTCNVCNEKDVRNASIYSLEKNGSDFKQIAKGLRNSVFLLWNKNDGKIWATEMGRDYLGDESPPDEINIIDPEKNSADYGWPICYGKNIHDSSFDKRYYLTDPCSDKIPSYFDIQAHSAPLGLAFIPEESSWPNEYQKNLFVAFHGSWNRSMPTGYKIVRLVLDEKENILKQEDFITGWLSKRISGRPVDILFDKDSMYISDDKTGQIYKVTYNK